MMRIDGDTSHLIYGLVGAGFGATLGGFTGYFFGNMVAWGSGTADANALVRQAVFVGAVAGGILGYLVGPDRADRGRDERDTIPRTGLQSKLSVGPAEERMWLAGWP